MRALPYAAMQGKRRAPPAPGCHAHARAGTHACCVYWSERVVAQPVAAVAAVALAPLILNDACARLYALRDEFMHHTDSALQLPSGTLAQAYHIEASTRRGTIATRIGTPSDPSLPGA